MNRCMIRKVTVYRKYLIKHIGFLAGSLESANWSILAARNLFKEVVGQKSGFYVNEVFKCQ